VNRLKMTALLTFALVGFLPSIAYSQDKPAAIEPVAHTYATTESLELKAYVFTPQSPKAVKSRAAIVIFHGGGWAQGEAEWAFPRAQHFAEKGMVAVAAQYRLSDRKTITPLEAMADARALLRWMRSNAATLGIDANRIVAYGWSAGGHLAASAAIFNDLAPQSAISSVPNALILVSPAVSLESDSWAQRLLGDRGNVNSISPDKHVRKGLPPTIILQGSDDTVTPLTGVQGFCDAMRKAGNRCDLQVYPEVGHLFTPKGTPDDGFPKPDRKVQAAAFDKADKFLASLGFIK
jgi:acetyl esterase